MKGLTPVIAVVLLIGITVAGAGSLYFFYDGLSSSTDTPEVTRAENLVKTGCWNEGTDSFIGVKNSGDKSNNISQLTVVVKGKQRSWSSTNTDLDAGEASTLKLDDTYLASRTSVKLVSSSNEKNVVCDIDDGSPPSPGGGSVPGPSPSP